MIVHLAVKNNNKQQQKSYNACTYNLSDNYTPNIEIPAGYVLYVCSDINHVNQSRVIS